VVPRQSRVPNLALKLSEDLQLPFRFDKGNAYFEGGIWQNIERGNPDLFKTAMSLNSKGRMGTAEEVAAGVVFLASPTASRVSGTNLIIDRALTKAV
jgi:3-oxoacyl-[acyl-carrier protein] reductase